MSKRLQLAGMKFGRLTVVSDVGVTSRKNVLWKCICDCGKECVTAGTYLKTGHKRSCGCLRIDGNWRTCGADNHTWRGGAWNFGSPAWAKRLITNSRFNARSGGYAPFDITEETLVELAATFNGKCGICEKEISGTAQVHLDHCHTTGVVRGFLCRKCNHALGLYSHNARTLINAAKWLERTAA